MAVERGIVYSAGKQTPLIEVIPGDPNRFSDPTVMLIDRTMRDIESPKEKAKLLLSLRRVFYKFGNAFTSEQTRKRFRLRFCTRVLSLASCLPEKNEVFSEALNDLCACLHEFAKEETVERQECVQTFIAALPYLLDMAEPDLIPKIRVAIEKSMNIRWVVDTTFTVPYGWIQLLGQVTFSVLSAKPEREKAIAEAAYQIFMTCIHPSLVFSRKSDVPNELLISKSTMAFGLIFMTRSFPDCLTDKEWKCLIQAIYIEALKPIIFDLLTKRDGETPFLSSQAAARLIRYSESLDPHLISICLEAAENHIPPVNKEMDYLLQLDCRIQWILAMSALAKRCNELDHDLAVHKILLTAQLVQYGFECMNDENYDDITNQLLLVMHEDFEVTETILSILPDVLEKDRTSFYHSMAVARIIRNSTVANSQLILLCMTGLKFNIPPITENEGYVIQAECRAQWILAMSALEKRCQERSMELVEQKILLIGQLVQYGFECVTNANYADIAEMFFLVMREDLDVAETILNILPYVLAEGRTSFCESMVIARIIRNSPVVNSQLIQICLKAVKFNIPPIADNDGYVIQVEYRAQWIMAMSALENKCQEWPIELVEQKIALTRDLIRFCLVSKDESSSKFVVKLLMEIMLSDLDVAEAINAILTVPSPSPITPHISFLKSQVERTIERLKKLESKH